MTQRALFVCSAKSAPVLEHGEADCRKIVETLTDALYGGAEVFMPGAPLLDCPTAGTFLNSLSDFIAATRDTAQRILYFTGHGRWEANQFAFEFGEDQFALFSVASTLLQGQGAAKTLFIIDACHSGGATSTGLKSSGVFPVSAGSCVLASCKDIELSREVAQQGSLFTHYFCEAITTGLGGKKSQHGMISVTDLLDYVKPKLEAHGESALTKQTPNYTISQGEGAFWIATNITGALVETSGAISAGPARDADPHRVPPDGATYDDLDEPAVIALAETELGMTLPGVEAAKQLGLFYSATDRRPTTAALLCLGKSPHHFFPEIESVFSNGQKSGKTNTTRIDGTLFRQFERLVELTLKSLDRHSVYSQTGVRTDEYEIRPEVLREAIANALTHRDFLGPGRVQVHVHEAYVEILNPGAFPEGHDWQALLDQPGASLTGNRRLANLLCKLGAVEGVGQGFHVLHAFREERGENAIRFEEGGGVVRCFVKRPPPELKTNDSEKAALATLFEREAQEQLGLALETQARSIERVSVLGERYELDQIFVTPELRDERGNISHFADVAQRITSGGGYRAVVVGAPGMGKTTFLKKLAQDLLPEAMRAEMNDRGTDPADSFRPWVQVADPVVLYLPLRAVNADLSLISALSILLGISRGTIDRLLREHSTVLLFDGFDEVAPEQRSEIAEEITRLAETRNNLSIVVTSRQTEHLPDLFPGAETLTIQPFSPAQTRRLVERSLPHASARFVLELENDTGLLANPLFAQIAGIVAREYGNVPLTRSRLVGALVETIMFRHDAGKGAFKRSSRVDPHEMIRLMQSIALMMVLHAKSNLHRDDAIEFIDRAIHSTRLRSARGYEADQILDEILELGFFLVRDGDSIVAFHRAIVEQLAVEGGRDTMPDAPHFTKLVMAVLRQQRSLPLAMDFVEGWVESRGQASDLIERLKAEREFANDVAALLEEVIDKVEALLPSFRAFPENLGDLLGGD
ncbi:caspase family protein [Sphingomonas sp. R647]|uniref:caspase family protein n=1 Tax=Sphingomonas sp. R647 TaxID=2875233 RepID=UPI001CD7F257|nr:caspase family protein [Sphingomonas sp. R647]MCA1197867.1 caspase family protein [Sphingomonas sp. R647]